MNTFRELSTSETESVTGGTDSLLTAIGKGVGGIVSTTGEAVGGIVSTTGESAGEITDTLGKAVEALPLAFDRGKGED